MVDVDAPVGSLLLQAKAYDNDTAVSDGVTYSIQFTDGDASNGMANSFVIDPKTGTVSLKEPLVAARGNVSFDIVARDSGTPVLETRVKAVILVRGLSSRSLF